DQDRGVVAPGGDQHTPRLVDPYRHQVLVAAAVAFDDIAAELLGDFEAFRIGIHHDDAVWVRAACDQLVDRLRTRDAVAEHHDMVRQLLLDAGHAPLLPTALYDEIVRRPDENEQDEDSHRRDDHGFEQPRPVAHRHDIAVSGGRDRDHREVDHVEEADVPVV